METVLKCSQWDDCGGRILLGDNTPRGEGAVLLRPIRFQCVEIWISTGRHCLYQYVVYQGCFGTQPFVSRGVFVRV
jgi:hypothetical protein